MTASRRTLAASAALALLVAATVWKLHTSHFQWGAFWKACRMVDWRLMLVAMLVLWTNFIFRAARWAVFLRPSLPAGECVSTGTLIPSQFIGFAGIAALGRVGEFIRPYLVSRRTGLPFPSQVAVMAVERVFDLGAFGIIFTTNLLISRHLQHLPYSNRFRQFGYVLAALIGVLVLFIALAVYAGPRMARLLGRVASRFSPTAGPVVTERILQFREGLNTVGSVADFIRVAVLSLLTWFSIALTYVVVCHAFPTPMDQLRVSHAILLLGFSVVGSLVQLPGVGGGTQVLTITALTVLFGIPKELATSAGLLLWAITALSVVLPGLLFARGEQMSLRSIARQSAASAPHPVH